MARQSKSDFSARTAQNKGVAHGTTKRGAGKAGVMRRWNANTARWEVASKPATAAPKRKVAGRGPSLGARARASKAATRYTSASVTQAPKTSWGTAKTSTPWNKPGGGGLIGPNSPLVAADKKVVKAATGAGQNAFKGVKVVGQANRAAIKGIVDTNRKNLKKAIPPRKYFAPGGGGLAAYWGGK